MDIGDSDSVSDLQNKIKLASLSRLLQCAYALSHSLSKANEGAGINTEPDVTDGVRDDISVTSSLHGMFAETNMVKVIVRPQSKSLLPCLPFFIFGNDILPTFAN